MLINISGLPEGRSTFVQLYSCRAERVTEDIGKRIRDEIHLAFLSGRDTSVKVDDVIINVQKFAAIKVVLVP